MNKPMTGPRLTALAGLSDFARADAKPSGEMQYLPVALIDEDPNQPRRTFDDATLRELGEDMQTNGQLQPIGVVPGEQGRYVLRFGARRLRACRMVGIPRIAYVLARADHGIAAQVAENQQREGLSNTDLAAAVARMTADGMKNKDIARAAGVKEYEIKYFRALGALPDFLAPWTDKADARALTELAQAWERNEAAQADIEAATEQAEDLTVAEVRRIIAATTGKIIQSFDQKPDRTPLDTVSEAGQLVQAPDTEPASASPKAARADIPQSPETEMLTWIIQRAKAALKDGNGQAAFEEIARKIMQTEHDT